MSLEAMDERQYARFLSHTDRTGECWLWTGSTDGYGRYGKMTLNKKTIASHRASYLHHHGEIPVGLIVRHKCVNKHCVNPDHLETGTHSQNNGEDRARDGTMTFAKLTADQVIQIRVLAEIGADRRLSTIGKQFGIPFQQVWDIVNRRTWKHVS